MPTNPGDFRSEVEIVVSEGGATFACLFGQTKPVALSKSVQSREDSHGIRWQCKLVPCTGERLHFLRPALTDSAIGPWWHPVMFNVCTACTLFCFSDIREHAVGPWISDLVRLTTTPWAATV